MAPQKTSVVTIDAYSGKVSGQFINYTTMDVNTATLSFQIMMQNNKLALATGITPKIVMNMEDGSQFIEDCEIVDATNGVVQYTLKSNEIKHSGRVDAEFYLVYADSSSVGSFTFTFYIKKSAIDTISVPAQEVAISDIETFKASLEARLDDTQATLTTVQQQVADAQTQANNIATLVSQNQVAKQSDLDATNLSLAQKAKQSDLDTANVILAGKATQRYVDVEDFPRQTGETDDLGRIKRAISYARDNSIRKVIFKPNGFYTISNQIIVYSNIELDLQGCTIQGVGTSVFNGFSNFDPTNGNNDIEIHHGILDLNRDARGVGADGASCGIRFVSDSTHSNSRINIHDLWVKGCPHGGMYLYNLRDSQIRNNKVSDLRRDGIVLWANSFNVSITDNQVWDVGDDCIGLNSESPSNSGTTIKHVTISGGYLSHRSDNNPMGGGIRLAGVWDVTVHGVTIESVQGEGIVSEGAWSTLAPSKRIAIHGNTIKRAGWNASTSASGISVSKTDNITIVGNVIEDAYNSGIKIGTNSTGTIVSGNSIIGGLSTSTIGIQILSENVVISNNHCKSIPANGILVLVNNVSITGNSIVDCGVNQSSVGYIQVNANFNDISICNNKIRRITSGYGSYGVRIATGTSGELLIVGNHVKGFGTGNGVSNAGTGTGSVLANNIDVA